jgi:hypothetical protein
VVYRPPAHSSGDYRKALLQDGSDEADELS